MITTMTRTTTARTNNKIPTSRTVETIKPQPTPRWQNNENNVNDNNVNENNVDENNVDNDTSATTNRKHWQDITTKKEVATTKRPRWKTRNTREYRKHWKSCMCCHALSRSDNNNNNNNENNNNDNNNNNNSIVKK